MFTNVSWTGKVFGSTVNFRIEKSGLVHDLRGLSVGENNCNQVSGRQEFEVTRTLSGHPSTNTYV